MDKVQLQTLFDTCWEKYFDKKSEKYFEDLLKNAISDDLSVLEALPMVLYTDLKKDLYSFLSELLPALLLSDNE